MTRKWNAVDFREKRVELKWMTIRRFAPTLAPCRRCTRRIRRRRCHRRRCHSHSSHVRLVVDVIEWSA